MYIYKVVFTNEDTSNKQIIYVTADVESDAFKSAAVNYINHITGPDVSVTIDLQSKLMIVVDKDTKEQTKLWVSFKKIGSQLMTPLEIEIIEIK